jgi:hypothetical protein
MDPEHAGEFGDLPRPFFQRFDDRQPTRVSEESVALSADSVKVFFHRLAQQIVGHRNPED